MSTSTGALGVHDVGGVGEALKSCLPATDTDAPIQHWEKKTHSLFSLMCIKKHVTVDELRQGIEELNADAYKSWGYYDKWASSLAQACLRRGLLEPSDFPGFFGGLAETDDNDQPRFQVGDYVRVKGESYVTSWRKPHLRTPGYVHGQVGRITEYCGSFGNPELLAFRLNGPKASLYRVRFNQRHLWEGYHGSLNDAVDVEIYQHWLDPATDADWQLQNQRANDAHSILAGDEDHGAHDEHDHEHDTRFDTEQNAVTKEGPPRPGEQLLEALVQGLTKRQLVTKEEIAKAMEGFDRMGSQHEGARLVARAWVDENFKQLLLQDATAAAAKLNIIASNAHTHTVLKVMENTPTEHNLVVCTLCSCYPLSILGPSPAWYKSRAYRARAVRDPRGLLADEFGLDLPGDMTLLVHDSTADLRYMVLPRRPSGTESWTEEQLQTLVTRDAMIGVSECRSP